MKKFSAPPCSLFLLSILGMVFLNACSSEEPNPVLPVLPPLPSYYGTLIRSDIKDVRLMTWAAYSGEIIIATESGLTMIDPVTKNSREFSIILNISSIGVAQDSTLYFVDYLSRLTALNLATMTFKSVSVDSIEVEDGSLAINSKHFAYSKYLPQDPGTMYLYDFATGTEKPLTKGMPCQFSPDGNKLLFSHESNFYSYDLQTQSVEFVTDVYAPIVLVPPKTMRWRPEGIVSYTLSGNGFDVTNESTKQGIAQWSEWFGQHFVSPSGNKVIVMEQRCANPTTDPGCSQFQFFGSVLHISTQVRKDLIYSTQLLFADLVFIRDETAVAYLNNSHSLYMVNIDE